MSKTFKEFILEDVDDNIIDILIKECRPFLEYSLPYMLGGRMLFRGLRDENSKFIKKTTRKDRVSRDSSKLLQDTLDSYFEKQFGFPYRSAGLFCTKNYADAQTYGSVYVVLPVGEIQNIKACTSEEVTDVWQGYFDDAYNHINYAGRLLHKAGKDFTDTIEKYGLYFEVDANYEYIEDLPDLPEFPTFKLAFSLFNNTRHYNHLAPVLNHIPVDKEQLENSFAQYITKEIFPLFEYKELNINELFNRRDNSELMLQCDKYYAINYDKLLSEHNTFLEKIEAKLKELKNANV